MARKSKLLKIKPIISWITFVITIIFLYVATQHSGADEGDVYSFLTIITLFGLITWNITTGIITKDERRRIFNYKKIQKINKIEKDYIKRIEEIEYSIVVERQKELMIQSTTRQMHNSVEREQNKKFYTLKTIGTLLSIILSIVLIWRLLGN